MLNKFFCCTLKARSSQKSGLLSALSRAKIAVWDVKTESNYITFTVKIKDLAKTFAILKNMCYNYSVCRRNDAKSLSKTLFSRIGLLLGLVFATILIGFSANLIVGVKIKTDDFELKSRISALASVKSAERSFKTNVNTQDLRAEIRSMAEVADCSVKIVGNYLEIDVLEAKKEEEREQVYTSYVAKYDATVISVIAHRGTPLVKTGDRVFAGTPLISPEVYNENGELITTVGISGKVIGEAVLRKTLTVDKIRTVTLKTGKRKTILSFSLKPQFVPSPYRLYEKTVSSESFKLFVPVFYTKTEFVEVEERSVETDIDAVAKAALDEFVCESGLVGEESSFTCTDNGKQYTVSLYIKVKTEIGIGV